MNILLKKCSMLAALAELEAHTLLQVSQSQGEGSHRHSRIVPPVVGHCILSDAHFERALFKQSLQLFLAAVARLLQVQPVTKYRHLLSNLSRLPAEPGPEFLDIIDHLMETGFSQKARDLSDVVQKHCFGYATILDPVLKARSDLTYARLLEFTGNGGRVKRISSDVRLQGT